MKVGINGMGRMGRLALRAAFGAIEREAIDPRSDNRLEVVHLNEIKGAAAAHLLAFDAVQGKWRADIAAAGSGAIRVNDQRRSFSEHPTAADIPWGGLGVDLVLECTGKFLTPDTLQDHLDRGAKRVIVAAPVKVGDVLNIVVGVNEHLYHPARHRIVTAASCTTNCLAPVVKVVHETIDIRHGQITTLHNPTNTNGVVDAPHKDLRRSRSAMVNLAPTTTSSGLAAARVALFGARDAWFVVGVSMFLYSQGWTFTMVGGFLASWTIGYGLVQAIVPSLVKRSADGLSAEVPAARGWSLALPTRLEQPGQTAPPPLNTSTPTKDAIMNTPKVHNVLFLCTGNSARSIMAESILNAQSAGQFRGFSAGSHPAGSVNPHALDLLSRHHYRTAELRSKSWDEFAAPDAPLMDFVFTVCDRAAAEVCPVWPGQPISAHWGVADPAAVTGGDETIHRAFNDAFSVLSRRISLFLCLPIDKLSRLALTQEVQKIGQEQAATV